MRREPQHGGSGTRARGSARSALGEAERAEAERRRPVIRRAAVALAVAGLLLPSSAAAVDRSRQHWFAYGQCTWLAYDKRPDIVNYGAENNGFYHWDGWEWSGHARAEGYPVNHRPRKGDIAVWQPHVGGAGSK